MQSVKKMTLFPYKILFSQHIDVINPTFRTYFPEGLKFD